MKKYIFTAIILLLCSATAINAQQNLRTAYFLDGYTYAYKFNPAMQGERGFFSIPVIGKAGLGVESDLALSTFLYPTENGSMTTFMNPMVSSADFLGALKDNNRFDLNLDVPILAFGFYTGKTYHIVDMSLRTDGGLNMPKSLFCFMKEGSSKGVTAWDISNIGARVDSRLELSYGLSRRMTENVSVGARFKILTGLARAEMLMNNMQLQMDSDQWAVNALGKLTVNGPITVGTTGGSNTIDWSTIQYPTSIDELKEMDFPVGFALDLGVKVDFLEYFTASAAVLDLGSVKWNSGFVATTPKTAWTFAGFERLKVLGDDSSLEDQVTAATEDLFDAFNFTKSAAQDVKSVPLTATAHLGIEARMPFYDRLSFGLLGTRRFGGDYSWTEARVSANVAPLNCLAFSCSYALSDFGSSLGAALNMHFGVLSLFAGLDSFLPLLNVTPQHIPIDNWNTNMTIGLNLAFGTYKGRFSESE